MGYALTETPTIYAYVDNKIVAVPEAKGSSKDENEATRSDDDDNDDSSSFPMWALAPIIIGGLAVVAAVVAGVIMMKKKKQQQQQGGQAMYAGVTATLTTPVSKVQGLNKVYIMYGFPPSFSFGDVMYCFFSPFE